MSRFQASNATPSFVLVIGILLCSTSVGPSAPLPGGVTVSAEIQPLTGKIGVNAELLLTVHLPPDWVVFDLEQIEESAFPTQIEIENSASAVGVENFTGPPAKERSEASVGGRTARYFDQSPTFRRPLLIDRSKNATGLSVFGKIDFSVKNEKSGRTFIVRDHPFVAKLAAPTPVVVATPPMPKIAVPAKTVTEPPTPTKASVAKPVEQPQAPTPIAPPPVLPKETAPPPAPVVSAPSPELSPAPTTPEQMLPPTVVIALEHHWSTLVWRWLADHQLEWLAVGAGVASASLLGWWITRKVWRR